MPDLILLAATASGTEPTWDGVPLSTGVNLRWLLDPALGYPDYGFTIERALAVPPADRGAIGAGTTTFDPPLVYLEMTAAAGGTVEVELSAGGTALGRASIAPGATLSSPVTLADTMVVSGAVSDFRYLDTSAPWQWQMLDRVGFPLRDPAYPGRDPNAASPVGQATARAGAAWSHDPRYALGFPQLEAVLRHLALGTPLPALQPTGSDPTLDVDLPSLLPLALLDPHLAHVVGVAYDDPAAKPDKLVAYRVTGHWRHAARPVPLGDRSSNTPVAIGDHHCHATVHLGQVRPAGDSVEVDLQAGGWLRLQAPAFTELDVTYESTTGVSLTADSAGQQAPFAALAAARTTRWRYADPRRSPLDAVIFNGPAQITLKRVELWTSLSRRAFAPRVNAANPGAFPPPATPRWLAAAAVGGGAGPLSVGDVAGLAWAPGTAPTAEAAAVRWQYAGHAESWDAGTGTWQAPAAFSPTTLLPRASAVPGAPRPGDPILVSDDSFAPVTSPSVAATVAGLAPMAVDGPLGPGRRRWWVRAVDIFGRVGGASTPTELEVVDDRPPPPPTLLSAEYAQSGLDPADAALWGRSVFAAAWLDAHPGQSAVLASWAWTPALAALAPDVDGFRLYVDDDQVDEVLVADTSFSGYVSAVEQTLAVTVSAVSTVPTGPAMPAEPSVAVPPATVPVALTTDLGLDTGSGSLALATLTDSAGRKFPVVGNTVGPSVVVIVDGSQATPAGGAASIDLSTTGVSVVTTDLAPAPLGLEPWTSRRGGMLIGAAAGGGDQGWSRAVLAASGTRYIVGTVARAFGDPPPGSPPPTPAPAVGDAATWFPGYGAAVADTGFGPKADATDPVATARVTVRARRTTAAAAVLVSADSNAGTATAVDATPPATPDAPTVPGPVGPLCVQAAGPADFHGRSPVPLSWAGSTGAAGYQVMRASMAALIAADRQAHAGGHDLNGLTGDVHDQLAALDTALAAGDSTGIDHAYLNCGVAARTWIAGQDDPAITGAFAQLFPQPTTATACTDHIPGLGDGSWCYRIVAVSAAGVESPWSASTPPICAPDVVAPDVPQPLSVLAADPTAVPPGSGLVVTWQAVTDGDLAGYTVYRSPDARSATDTAAMEVAATVPRDPAQQPGAVVTYNDTGVAAGTWYYRVSAVDTSGNESAACPPMRGRALEADPAAPTLDPPSRNGTSVALTWTAADDRLACLVQRRSSPSGVWRSLSDWLPRGQYGATDDSADPTTAYDYRVSAKSRGGLIVTSDAVTLAAP